MSLEEFRRSYLKLDTANQKYIEPQYVKQGDYNGRELVVQLTDGGVIKDQTGVSLNLGWKHIKVGNKGLDNFTALDITQGLFKIYYPTEMLNPGEVLCMIQIIENGQITGTFNFTVNVEKSPIDETAIVSDNSFTALQEALIEVNTWNGRIDAVEQSYIVRLNQADTNITQFLTDSQVTFDGFIVDANNELTLLFDDFAAENSTRLTNVENDFSTHKTDETAHGIGDKSTLQTTDKTTIVSAVNELFTNVSDGKTLVGTAITDVDNNVVVPTNPTFQNLADAIGGISTGKQWASGNNYVSTSTLRFYYLDDSSTFNQFIDVSGLDFNPEAVIIHGASSPNYTILLPTNMNVYGGRIVRGSYASATGKSGSSLAFKLTGEAQNINGFTLPVGSSGTYEWIAFE